MQSSPRALAALVAANLIPLIGVTLFGWELYAVMLVYWVENGVLGVFTLLRMATAGRERRSALAMGPFFVVHCGGFWVGHGTLLAVLFSPLSPFVATAREGTISSTSLPASLPIDLPGIGNALWAPEATYAVLALVLSHGASFVENWWRGGERANATPRELMFGAYGRVMVLHIALIGAGFAIMALGAPVLALVGLIVLKIGLDTRAHLVEHARRARRGAKAS